MSQVALVRAATNGAAGMFAMFGGQGYAYLDELRSNYIYDAASNSGGEEQVVALVRRVSEALAQEAASPEAQATKVFASGLDVVSWLEDKGKVPSSSYLHSAAVSYALIALAQLSNYVTAMSKLGVTQAEMLGLLKGAAGHSQGVVAAVVVSVSKTDEELLDNAVRFCKYLFWQGLRCHMTLRDQGWRMSMGANGDVASSPMLSVTGLTPVELRKLIAATNEKLRRTAEVLAEQETSKVGHRASDQGEPAPVPQVYLSLVNGITDCVVSGPPKALEALQAAVAKASVKPGESQNRVPYSKRLPDTSTAFLKVSAPFHCPMNADKVAVILADAARVGLKLSPSDLPIPVFSTVDGSNLQEASNKAAPVAAPAPTPEPKKVNM